ncbi:MAG: hypothetical protein OQL19_21835 [Gammaproteobacteria bacterium]|nr:hypothetical protein [Gammaproteobacteria bacterium]
MNNKLILNCIIIAVTILTVQNSLAEKLVMLPVMDTTRNMVMFRMPFPENWKMHTPKTIEDPQITAPGGIKVFYRMGGNFSYNNDPYMQQLYQQTGQTMRAPISAEQIIEQDLKPQVKELGLKYIKQYPLPEIAQRSKTYSSKLYKSLPTQDYFDAVGSEWKDDEGNTILVIIDQSVYSGQGSTFWSYQYKILQAPSERFKAAKKAFIYGIVNTQDNEQQIQAYNASERQKSNQSWTQHNTRMRQNQKNFDRQQKIHRDTSNAVNNSIMSTYRNQNAASDRGQQQILNSINEENTMTNPYNGQQYQVESGADQYWMNNDNEYIQSNDAFYDPNMDPYQNNQEWQELQPGY